MKRNITTVDLESPLYGRRVVVKLYPNQDERIYAILMNTAVYSSSPKDIIFTKICQTANNCILQATRLYGSFNHHITVTYINLVDNNITSSNTLTKEL